MTIVLLGLSATTYTSLLILSIIQLVAALLFVWAVVVNLKKADVKNWLYKLSYLLLPNLLATACISISAGTGYTNSLISCHSACSDITDAMLQTSQSCFNIQCSSDIYGTYTSNLSYHLYAVCVSIFLLLVQVIIFTLAVSFVIEIEESTQKLLLSNHNK